MQVLAVAGTILWFLLVALFWSTRPGELVWFAGSMTLGVAYFVGFFFYVTRRK